MVDDKEYNELRIRLSKGNCICKMLGAERCMYDPYWDIKENSK